MSEKKHSDSADKSQTFRKIVIWSKSTSWCSEDQTTVSHWGPSAECLGLFRPRLATSLYISRCKTQTVESPRSDQEVGEARQSHRCASLWSDSAYKEGVSISQLTDLSSDVLKGSRADQGEAYQEHILGETREMPGWDQSLCNDMNFYGHNSVPNR